MNKTQEITKEYSVTIDHIHFDMKSHFLERIRENKPLLIENAQTDVTFSQFGPSWGMGGTIANFKGQHAVTLAQEYLAVVFDGNLGPAYWSADLRNDLEELENSSIKPKF